MKRHSTIFTLVLVVFLSFFIIRCSKNNNPTEPNDNNGTRISETAVVLTNPSLNNLVSIDSTSLTFASTDQVRNLTPGKIIVINKDEGYLRKVVSLQTIGNNIKVSTEQARLEEVITQGSFEQEITLQPNNVVSSVFSDDKIKFKKTFDDFSLIFNQVKFGVGGTITIDGKTQFPAPKLKIKPVFNNGLESLDVSVQINASTQFILKSDVGITFGGGYTPPWAQFTFAPITVFIGVVPVLITPKIKLEFGVAAKISGKVEVNYNVSTQITGGINYQRNNSSLTPYATVSQSTSNKNIITPAKGSIEGSIVLPKVGFYFYSLAGPFIDFKLYGGLRDKTAQTVALYYGGSLEGGVETSILGYFNMPEAQWKTSKNLFENELATLTFNQPPLQPSNPSPNDNATSQSLNPSIGWVCSDPENDPLKYDVYLDQRNPPTTKISSSQSTTSYNVTGLTNSTTYYWQVTAKDDHSNTTTGPVWKFTTSAGSTTPTVTTSSITSFTTNSAVGGGNVTSQGSSSVTARGVCWSTSQNPTTSDSKTSDGSGTGSFTSSITGLNPSTLYYVRAYATNSAGTSYGSQVSFTTSAASTPPTVTTSSITSITSNSATGGGNVTSQGSSSVTARGVCWSTSQNPTTSENKTSDGSGTGSFTSSITGLSSSTLYYVRAYATNSAGTSYGSQVSFTTSAGTTPPTVTTSSITSITTNSAAGGGNVTSQGSSSVTSRGVCWSTSQNPTTSDNKTNDGIGTGSFTSSITGLGSSTLYYVRAYATNSAGTSYGSQVSFTTTSGTGGGSSCVGVPTVTYAGKTYNTVQIGTQCWLKENLDVGTMIQGSQDQTNNTTIEKYCFNDDPNNCATYGGLYQWNEAMQYVATEKAQGICPTGWHIPTLAEFQTLQTTANNSRDSLLAVGQLTGTDTYGFSALLAGCCDDNGNVFGLGYATYFWSSKGLDSDYAGTMDLYYNLSLVYLGYCTKSYGFSVRCVKD